MGADGGSNMKKEVVMEIPIYQVDAFTDRLFGGNPAAVCPLQAWLADDLLQDIAMENNLSETAYLILREDHCDIRWFTPAVEIDLAGHPTLAAAHVVLEILRPDWNEVRFQSPSGPLTVTRNEDRLVMDFPARPGKAVDPSDTLNRAFGAVPRELYLSRDHMAVFDSEEEVAALCPDMRLLRELPSEGVIATAPGHEVDFVSRFFAPRMGIDEDPVTGSAHCTLIPYWSERLGKEQLLARQISKRMGQLWCRNRRDRVAIEGQTVLYMEGRLYLHDNGPPKENTK
jgi:predicted PhzF superfamily epimerase YddE/YHI9